MTDATGLRDRHALVTGAASGIGRAVALALAAEGAQVTATDRDGAGLDGLAAEHGAIATHVADLADPEAAAGAVAAVAVGAGPDVLISNAGVGFAATAVETSLEQWETTFAVNARGPFLLARAALPGMLERGHGVIVNVASAAAIAAVANRAAYCASKAAVIGLTKALAVDHARAGIRVNCVAPGTVDSPWIGRIVGDEPGAQERRRAMEERQLIGRLGTVDEIASAVVFLASERASFLHGSVLVADGGFTAR